MLNIRILLLQPLPFLEFLNVLFFLNDYIFIKVNIYNVYDGLTMLKIGAQISEVHAQIIPDLVSTESSSC